MRRAQRRKHHYFYKTTCIVTGRYYYGMHSTDNLEDGYIGSGKRLWYSINKHGKENHKMEILKFFETREKLRDWEIKVVNEDLLKDPNCMNLVTGGSGGGESFIKLNANKEVQKKKRIKALKKLKWLRENDKEWFDNYKKTMSNSLKGKQIWKDKNHSTETKEKMSITHKGLHKGKLNTQYGTCWITNEVNNKKIKKGESIPNGWRLGRKMKN